MRVRLTEDYVRKLPLAQGAPYLVRDAKTPGLLVGVSSKSKSYKIQRDLRVGERGHRRLIGTIKHTLGRTDELRLDEARAQAVVLLDHIRRGIDPFGKELTTSEGWTLAEAFDNYIESLRIREKGTRTIAGVAYRRDKYVGARLLATPILELLGPECIALHRRISQDHGRSTANHVLRDIRAAYNLARKHARDQNAFRSNPVYAVTFHPERRRDAMIEPDDLAQWWHRVKALPNPLWRELHKLALLSGLRIGALATIRRDWIRPDDSAIVIPAGVQKSGRPFVLVLSAPMVAMVRRALAAGDVLYPGSDWLFPTRGRDGTLKPIVERTEGSLPSETGHILRHTYRTMAQRVGVDDIDVNLLMDHAVRGVTGVYLHQRGLLERLRG